MCKFESITEMWLPRSVYEALPWIYIAIGGIFIGGAVYLGITSAESPPYLGIGVISILTGLFVRTHRHRSRDDSSQPDTEK